MIKICEVAYRRPGMGVADFQAYWLGVHGPIIARIPGVRRYVQCHPNLSGYGKGELICDGVAEIWVDDKEALRAVTATVEFAAAKRDEPNFIDVGRLVELLTSETVIKDGRVPANGVKSISLLKFKSGMDPAEAQNHWRRTHGPIAAEIETLRRYVQCPARLGAYGRPVPPVFDGLAMAWFDSVGHMRQSARSDAYARTKADEENFLEPGRIGSIITREHVIIG
ncbi:MAG: EthD domain-containing protein [Proteobacteria bacterium]|nr:EthD domain-containing protein [Pseudomonadota bacterium]